MLRPNNPEIDFELLNRRIQESLDAYIDEGSAANAFDPDGAMADSEDEQTVPVQACEEHAPVDPATKPPVLAYDDCEFVREAYKQLLGREPDPEGLEHYAALLREGGEKTQLLERLWHSEEARLFRENSPHQANLGTDLNKYRSKQKLFQLPLVGPILRVLNGSLTLHKYKLFLNARLNHSFRLHQEQRQELNQRFNDLQQHVHQQQSHLEHLQAHLHDTQQKLIRLERKHQTLLGRLKTDQSDLLQREKIRDEAVQQLRLRLTALESRPVAASAATVDDAGTSAPVAATATDSSSINEAFYAAFEEHFRGDRKTILERMQYYLPLLERCEPLKSGGKLVDIGCGRGDWLDLLASQGYPLLGIDFNHHNVEACVERGHEAIATDGIEWLRQQPDNSIAAISCFHVIEHLPFEVLSRLLDESLRVLRPGGLFFAETPNPENLVTGITHFYTDPTHLHPLPPAFSEFLLQYKGFGDVELHRLNPIPEEFALIEHGEVDRRCNQYFYGPQDYAVVGIKP
ncbi:methyltransferase domain-containing protein [Pseudomaricurvus alkylphenolicus]|uniref:methyltransferase domain-containing protein n=1 Tax=Pseudomaricurvus alkylphenolicus TaxID=1306991 RepID=UPI001422F12B|nr:methyltransferase domain-containing protein [Pseudomaricurvus alkylphenolicus]NIB42101.1 methyltransferase domain-containing protein [Pseudomaricurvus alkylphenolicus]